MAESEGGRQGPRWSARNQRARAVGPLAQKILWAPRAGFACNRMRPADGIRLPGAEKTGKEDERARGGVNARLAKPDATSPLWVCPAPATERMLPPLRLCGVSRAPRQGRHCSAADAASHMCEFVF